MDDSVPADNSPIRLCFAALRVTLHESEVVKI